MELSTGIVCILNHKGSTAGTGFVVSKNGLVATCAHVVDKAGAKVGDQLQLVFHNGGEICKALVEPAWWRKSEDVAILRLSEPVPAGVQPLSLGSSGGLSGHEFKTFGYPFANGEGIWGYGRIGDKARHTGYPVLQLTGTTEVTRGFSGAPVYDTVTRRVVGMVSTITLPEKHGRLTETAFIIPSETLRDVCPDLGLSDVCPYRGLAAFTENDAPFFFGRQQLVETLLAQLRRSPRFVALVGPSGSGKTSVVQAGLFPALKHGQGPGGVLHHILTLRPGSDPFANLNIVGLAVGDNDSLKSRVQRLLDEQLQVERLLLFLDQFEELFALTNEHIQERFLTELLELLESSAPVTVIINIRADFYGHLLKSKAWTDWLAVAQVNVPPMGVEEVRAAIEEPAYRVGLRFEAGLVPAVVEDASRTEHPLPLLESALTQIWKYREEGMLTHKAYQNIGRVTGAISQWADDAYNGLSLPLQKLARQLFTRLIHYGPQKVNDTRQGRTLPELIPHPKYRRAVIHIIRQLANARLLLTDQDLQTGAERVEIIHDALLREWGRLQHWRDENRSFLLWRQRLQAAMEEWEQNSRNTGNLLRAEPLTQARRWAKERPDDLNPDELNFIHASVALQKRQQQRWIASLTIVSIVVIALLLVAGQQSRRATSSNARAEFESVQRATADAEAYEQSRKSLAGRLVEQAADIRANQPDLAALLSLEAYRIGQTAEARSSVFSAFQPSISRTLHGHTDSVTSIAYNAEGTILVSGSADTTVILWDAQRGQPIGAPFTDHQAPITSVALSPAGDMLATSSSDGTIILWDVTDRQPVGPPLSGHSLVVNDIDFSPDGQTLAAGGGEIRGSTNQGELTFWNVVNRQLLGSPITSFGHPVTSLAFSPDGSTLALGIEDYTVVLWNVATQQPIGSPMRGHFDAVMDVAFSPDGSMIASGGRIFGPANEGGEIFLWDAAMREVLHGPLTSKTRAVKSVAFSPDGSLLVSNGGLGDNAVITWPVEFPEFPQAFVYSAVRSVESVAFGSDGTTVAAGLADGKIVLWNIDSSLPPSFYQLLSDEQSMDMRNRMGSLDALAFGSNGELLFSEGLNGVIGWNVKSRQMHGPAIPISQGSNFTVSANGELLASALDQTISLWDIASGQLLRQMFVDQLVTGLAFGIDGNTLLSFSDGILNFWNVTSGELFSSSNPVPGDYTLAAHSLDGQKLAYRAPDGSIVVWDVESNQRVGQVENVGASVAISSDGKTLAWSNQSNNIFVWDVTAGEPIGLPLSGHTDIVRLTLSPDGKLLASGSYDGTIKIWDISTGINIASVDLFDGLGFSVWVERLLFSADGNYVSAVGNVPNHFGGQSYLLLWDISIESWQSNACRIVNRNLSQEEWQQYIPGEPYRRTCPDIP